MKLHPRRLTLLAWDAGGLGPSRARAVAQHLADCVACRRVLAWRRGLRAAVTDATSPPAPDVLGRVGERLDAGESRLLPVPGPKRAGRTRRRWLAPAAAAALLAGVGSVAAASGLLDLGPLARRMGIAPPAVDAPATAPAPVGGVEVEIPPGGLTVELEEVSPQVMLVVGWSDGLLVEITGWGAAAAAGYRLGAGRVVVRGGGSGEVRVGVPRGTVGAVRVVVGDQVVAVAQDGLVRLRGREPGAEGRATLRELLREGVGP